MASFSNPSKTYAGDKLSKCATTVLLVCCYLYRKRSNTINVNTKAKEQGRDMQTPINDSDILPRYREACKLPPSPRWRPSQGLSSRSGNSMDSLRPSPRVSGSPTCFPVRLSRMLPAVFTIKLSAELPRALFPPVHGGGHTINVVGVISQDYKPLQCTTMVRASTEW